MDPKRTITVVSTIAVIALVASIVKGASVVKETSTASTGDPNTLNLLAGWNLVGFDVTSPTTTPDSLFSGQTYYIWKWSAENKKYASPSTTDPVELGVGYWIWVGAADNVTLPDYPTGSTQYQSASYVVAAYNSIDNENANFVCTGTDDQVTINNAINNLPASGGSIYLREGTYILSNSIAISKSNVTLVGAGASTVLKIKDSKNADMNVIDASGMVNLLIQNLRIDGNSANQSTGWMYGIYFTGVDSSKIIDCWIENLNYLSIFLYSSSNNNTLTGNTVTGNNDGIELESSSNITVTGNTVTGNGRLGIMLDYESSNNTVVGNTVVGNSQYSDNHYDGININYDSDYNNIQGNTVRRGTGTNQQRYGIRINSADCDNNLVINNDLYQAGKAADFIDSGTLTIFRNNRLTSGWVVGYG
jgi:parallel beta-helix repeat protein